MTREGQAVWLLGSERFFEWLDATEAHPSGWPHNATTAREWLLQQCGVESLRHIAAAPGAAAAFDQIERRFAVWERNQELGL